MCLGYRGEDGSDSDWSYISGRGLEGRPGQGCVHFFPSPSFLLPFSSLFLLGRAALAGPPAAPQLLCLLSPCISFSFPFRTEQRSSAPRSSSSSLTRLGPRLSSSSAPRSFNIHSRSRWATWCGTNTLATSPSLPQSVSTTRRWPHWLHRLIPDSSEDTIWASFWGIYYRKFFFDFVNGIVRSPGGVQ